MPLLVTLGNIRDVIIIIYGVLGIVFFIAAIGLCIGIYLGGKEVLRQVKTLLDETLKPTLGSVRSAAETVRGTTEFVGRRAITPIIKTYGAYAGVRRGLGLFGALGSRKKKT